MYGLIGKLRAKPGQASALADILSAAGSDLPGCRSYVVALDPSDPDAVWVTEVWDDRASHEASLGLPRVQSAIAEGRPLIDAFEERTVTEPVGGHGLS